MRFIDVHIQIWTLKAINRSFLPAFLISGKTKFQLQFSDDKVVISLPPSMSTVPVHSIQVKNVWHRLMDAVSSKLITFNIALQISFHFLCRIQRIKFVFGHPKTLKIMSSVSKQKFPSQDIPCVTHFVKFRTSQGSAPASRTFRNLPLPALLVTTRYMRSEEPPNDCSKYSSIIQATSCIRWGANNCY